jgi:DNA-directed RNA polymerase specialized sigma24 family protein
MPTFSAHLDTPSRYDGSSPPPDAWPYPGELVTIPDDPPISDHSGAVPGTPRPPPVPLDPAAAAMMAAQWEDAEKAALAFVRRLSGSRREAEEMVQEACVQILGGEQRWDPATPLKPYLCGVARNLWSQREVELKRQTELDPHDTGGPPAQAPDPERLVSIKREHEANVALLDELAGEFPEGSLEARIIALSRDEMSEPKEQAAHLGVDVHLLYNAKRNLGTAMERLQRAKRKKAQLRGP